MTIVVYQCDVCKRQIERQQKPKGLEVVSRCVVTHGCRGKMFQVQVLPDFIRGQTPDYVSGLDDWIQRKVLHNHVQTIEQLTWTIEHNMGGNPVVSTYVNKPTQADPDNQEEIQPLSITIVTEDIIKVTFDREYSGIAQLIARQSDPDLLNPPVRAVEEQAVPLQISNLGELTIATQIGTVGENTFISLNVGYSTSDAPVFISYTADDQPSINSPWVDFDKIIVRGKIYTVRTFTGLVSEMVNGAINDGSTFRFAGIDENGTRNFREIQRGEVLLLLAKDPYQRVDKLRDVYIDSTVVTTTDNIFALFYDNGEFYADQNIVQSVYPHIRSI